MFAVSANQVVLLLVVIIVVWMALYTIWLVTVII